jgi:fructose-1,6-bisphosphatase/sedoheptulose 1,7-bisphosphatase-like protein
LQAGEAALAVHPRCGTNLVVAGLLTALAAILAVGRKPSIKKLPDVILATTFAAFIAQPLGLTLQARVTTSPDAIGARITGIREQFFGQLQVQHVDIEWD